MNLWVCGDVFVEAGVKVHPTFDGSLSGMDMPSPASNVEAEFSSRSAFDVLIHWRRSPVFGEVRNMIFVLDSCALEWTLQMRQIIYFFTSLPAGAGYVEELYVCMDEGSERDCLDVGIVIEMMNSVIRAGCIEFTFDSLGHSPSPITSQFSLPSADDSLSASRLRTLRINSDALSTFPMQQWLAAFQSDTQVLDSLGLSCFSGASDWSTFLAGLRFSHLKSLQVAGAGISSLAEFLKLHPDLFSVELECLKCEEGMLRIPRISMPSLGVISGDALQLEAFLRMLDGRPLTDVVLDLELDSNAISAETCCLSSFDSDAHLKLFHYLSTRDGPIHVLNIIFPDLELFTEPFLDQNLNARPENSLEVISINIDLRCSESKAIVPLLVCRPRLLTCRVIDCTIECSSQVV